MGIPSYSTASTEFGILGGKCLNEILRNAQHSMMEQARKSDIIIMLYSIEKKEANRKYGIVGLIRCFYSFDHKFVNVREHLSCMCE